VKEDPKTEWTLSDPWLTTAQAAALTGLSEKTIRRAYLTRRLEHTRVGRNIRFRRSWLDAYVEQGRVQAVA